MDNEVEQEAARFIRNSSVNVQLSFTVDYSGELLIVMRALPWKNSSSPNRMILVSHTSILSALLLLAEGLYTNAWIPLDWKALPLVPGIYKEVSPVVTDLQDKIRRLRDYQARTRDHLVEDTGDLPI